MNADPKDSSVFVRLPSLLDAWILKFWMKKFQSSESTMEKELLSFALFALSSISGMVFVFIAVAQNPELNFTKGDTLRTSFAIPAIVGLLWYFCGRSAHKTRPYPIELHESKLTELQPLRSLTLFLSSATLIISFVRIGKPHLGAWYMDEYLFLALSMFSALSIIYMHSALLHLNLAEKIVYKQRKRIKDVSRK